MKADMFLYLLWDQSYLTLIKILNSLLTLFFFAISEFDNIEINSKITFNEIATLEQDAESDTGKPKHLKGPMVNKLKKPCFPVFIILFSFFVIQ